MADPFSSFAQGFALSRQAQAQQGQEPTGLELLQDQLKRDQDLQLQRGRLDIQKLQLQGQEARTSELALKAEQQQAESDLVQSLPLNPTGEQLRGVAFQLSPEKAKTLIENNEAISDVVHQSTISRTGPVIAALKTGQTGIALDTMDGLIEAFQSGGDTERADNWQLLRDQAASGAEGARGVEQFLLAKMAFTPGADEAIKNINAVEDDRRKKALEAATKRGATADADLKEINRDINKRDLQRKRDGLPTDEQRIGIVRDFKSELFRRTVAFRTSSTAFDTLNAAIEGGGKSGIDDLALIQAITRIMDPGAVVRQSDIDLTENASGDAAKMANLWAKFWDGTTLKPAARKAIMALGKRDMEKKIARNKDLEDGMKEQMRAKGIPPEEVFTDVAAEQRRERLAFEQEVGVELSKPGQPAEPIEDEDF